MSPALLFDVVATTQSAQSDHPLRSVPGLAKFLMMYSKLMIVCGFNAYPMLTGTCSLRVDQLDKLFWKNKLLSALKVVLCEHPQNSFAPKLVRSCGNPLTTPEPMTKTTTKFAMWAPWEVHLATGLSLGPDAAKFQRQRVEKVEVENVDPIIASNCLVWAKCMAQERCRYMYNRHCIKN